MYESMPSTSPDCIRSGTSTLMTLICRSLFEAPLLVASACTSAPSASNSASVSRDAAAAAAAVAASDSSTSSKSFESCAPSLELCRKPSKLPIPLAVFLKKPDLRFDPSFDFPVLSRLFTTACSSGTNPIMPTGAADPATAGGAPSRLRLPWIVFSSTPHLVLASSALAGGAPPSTSALPSAF